MLWFHIPYFCKSKVKTEIKGPSNHFLWWIYMNKQFNKYGKKYVDTTEWGQKRYVDNRGWYYDENDKLIDTCDAPAYQAEADRYRAEQDKLSDREFWATHEENGMY